MYMYVYVCIYIYPNYHVLCQSYPQNPQNTPTLKSDFTVSCGN